MSGKLSDRGVALFTAGFSLLIPNQSILVQLR